MEDLAFVLIVDAQISTITTAGLKADLKKTPKQSDYNLALPWNLDLSLRPLLTQTQKPTTIPYKEALGLVATT